MEWVRETGLAGNLWKEDMVRLEFQAESNLISEAKTTASEASAGEQQDWMVTLKPMEIRTFILKVVFG